MVLAADKELVNSIPTAEGVDADPKEDGDRTDHFLEIHLGGAGRRFSKMMGVSPTRLPAFRQR